ncbi:MAG: hypothetical protein GX561_09755 [Lentisphaerae bacterium]|jgi:hypothetical protein|nr:hypothetical protein [Lentisphaerota bacterium]
MKSRTLSGLSNIAFLAIVICASRVSGISYYTEVLHAGRFRIKATNEQTCRSVGFFASHCSDFVDRFLGISGQPTRQITIVELSSFDDDDETTSRYKVTFGGGKSDTQVIYSLVSTLLYRRVQELKDDRLQDGDGMVGIIPSPQRSKKGQERPIAHCVASALTHRVAGRTMPGKLLTADYEVARNQFAKNEFPEVDKLLAEGIDADFGPIFDLYMMHCDLLMLSLETLKGSQRQRIQNLLIDDRNNLDPIEAFDKAFATYYEKDETRQAFYVRRVAAVSRRRHRGSSTDVIADAVQELETVKVVGGSGPAGLKTVRLEDMPKLLEDYKTDTRAFLQLEQKFRELKFDAPLLLQPSLDKYILALQHIREGQTRRFKRDFRNARKEFQEALQKQRKIEAILDDEERKHISAGRRFEDYLEIIDRYRDFSDQLRPGNPIFNQTKKP